MDYTFPSPPSDNESNRRERASVMTMTAPSLVAINKQKGNERGDGDGGVGRRRLIQEERSTTTTMENQRALTAPSPMEATGEEEEEGDEVGVEEIMTTFLGRRGG
jgi:hypothetical protein